MCSSPSFSFLFVHIFLQSSGLLCFFLASRTKLTSAAEKESIAMFVRNLRQRLLAGPVRGSVIMGVDPGYKHGCKLAILSPTSKSLQTKTNIIFCCALFIYLTKETNTFSLSYRKLISGYRRLKFDLSCAISFHDISISFFFMIFRSDSAYRYFLPSHFKSTKRNRKAALSYEQIQVLMPPACKSSHCFFFFLILKLTAFFFLCP